MRPTFWTIAILLTTVFFCLAAEQTAQAGQKWTVLALEVVWIAVATNWLIHRFVAKDWPKLPIIW